VFDDIIKKWRFFIVKDNIFLNTRAFQKIREF
jgi:hypothetical protein